ncbi:hypothetical protein J8273_5527 [Carpediemonas membranifera]|uniref:Uncharacterized protein n=1 Tax=Carpediemonas membranifera TaxID=201153 RepID=A0A8J6B445_9EUKA|nr:hypothetical protein J8273_5527 [Carpediemonas membranifera]|eukprot:KAG9392522.1 hypothetical protein J8273_5527 [Carpediemonas membranifera]
MKTKQIKFRREARKAWLIAWVRTNPFKKDISPPPVELMWNPKRVSLVSALYHLGWAWNGSWLSPSTLAATRENTPNEQVSSPSPHSSAELFSAQQTPAMPDEPCPSPGMASLEQHRPLPQWDLHVQGLDSLFSKLEAHGF